MAGKSQGGILFTRIMVTKRGLKLANPLQLTQSGQEPVSPSIAATCRALRALPDPAMTIAGAINGERVGQIDPGAPVTILTDSAISARISAGMPMTISSSSIPEYLREPSHPSE